jgi:hypothetical protein
MEIAPRLPSNLRLLFNGPQKKMFFLLQRPFSSIGSYMKKFKA